MNPQFKKNKRTMTDTQQINKQLTITHKMLVRYCKYQMVQNLYIISTYQGGRN